MATFDTAVFPETLADLLKQIGKVPLERIRLRPLPGTATEKDVVAALEKADKRLLELVDGVLVEKPMGVKESILAMDLGYFLKKYLEDHGLGLVLGPDGPIHLRLGLVRIPDVCFISWKQLPGQEIPDEPISSVIPELAIEVLSKSNTRSEMERKVKDYFEAGVRLVWFIQPKTETAQVFSSPDQVQLIPREGVLDGEDILPGFSLSLKELFGHSQRRSRRGK